MWSVRGSSVISPAHLLETQSMQCSAEQTNTSQTTTTKNGNKSRVKSAERCRRNIFPWQHTNKLPISVTMKLCRPAVMYNAYFLLNPRRAQSACETWPLATQRPSPAPTLPTHPAAIINCLSGMFRPIWRGEQSWQTYTHFLLKKKYRYLCKKVEVLIQALYSGKSEKVQALKCTKS